MLNEEPQFLLSVAPLALRELRSSSGASVSGPWKREEAGGGGLSEAMGGGGAAHYPWYNCSQALTPNCKVGAEEAARLFPTRKQKQSKTLKWSGLARRI